MLSDAKYNLDMPTPADMILDPDGHRPHGPLFGFGAHETDDIKESELYQPPRTEDIPIIEARVREAVDLGKVTNLQIDDLQAWCELNWKEPHGTIRSQDRFRKKLVEEFKELKDELEKVEAGEQGNEAQIVSELGDVLWATSALSSNIGRKIKTGLMERMHQYGKGTRYVDGQTPPWVEIAQRLAYDEKDFALGKLEELVEAGYSPQPSPFMYIDDDSRVTWEEIDQAKTLIFHNLRTLDYIAENVYDADTYQSGVINSNDADAADNLIAEVYLNCAFLAKHVGNSSLSEVVRQNILKVSGRVQTNTIDKSDNPR